MAGAPLPLSPLSPSSPLPLYRRVRTMSRPLLSSASLQPRLQAPGHHLSQSLPFGDARVLLRLSSVPLVWPSAQLYLFLLFVLMDRTHWTEAQCPGSNLSPAKSLLNLEQVILPLCLLVPSPMNLRYKNEVTLSWAV